MAGLFEEFVFKIFETWLDMLPKVLVVFQALGRTARTQAIYLEGLPCRMTHVCRSAVALKIHQVGMKQCMWPFNSYHSPFDYRSPNQRHDVLNQPHLPLILPGARQGHRLSPLVGRVTGEMPGSEEGCRES